MSGTTLSRAWAEPRSRPATVVLLLLGRASLVAASAVSTRMATSLLGAGEMGALSLLLGVVALPALLVSPFGQYVNRQAMEWRLDRSMGANVGRYLRFLMIAALLSAAAAMAARALAGPRLELAGPPVVLGLLVAASVAIVGAQGALLHLCNLGERRLGYVALSNLSSWGGLGLAVLVAPATGGGAIAWMGSLLCVQLVTALLAARLVAADLQPGEPATTPKAADFRPAQVWPFAWPLLVCCGLYWVQRSAALPWLAASGDAQTLGHFSVAFSVGMLVMLSFDTLFKEAYAPLYYRATAHADARTRGAAWNRYARAFVPALAAAGLCTVAAAAPLLRWLTAEPFHPWTAYLAWGVASQCLISLYSLCVLEAASSLRNRSLIVPNLTGAAATLLLLLLPLEIAPGLRAALATTGGLACTTLLAALDVAHRPGLRWPLRRLLLATGIAAPVFALAPLLSAPAGRGAGSLALLLALGAFGAAVQLLLGRWWLRAEPSA